MPLVSILMPAYNAGNYIAEAIGSIMGQTFTDWELVVVNDGSSDGTAAIVEGIRDERIKFYSNDRNRGLAFTRNRLLELASGEFIAFLDSDDIAVPQRLALQLEYFRKHPETGLLGGSLTGLSDAREDRSSFRFDLSACELPAHLLFYNPVSTSSVMLRRSALPEQKFREDFPPVEDYELWSRILRQHPGAVLRDMLGYYRLHGQSISKQLAPASYANRNRVVLDQLEYYFPGEYSEAEKEIHLGLADLNRHKELAGLPALGDWILRLVRLNDVHRRFDPAALRQVLYERLLKKLLRLDRYERSVLSAWWPLRSQLQPRLNGELRKKELAILAFSLAGRKFIATD